MDTSTTQEINVRPDGLKDIIRTFHAKTTKYTFSSAHMKHALVYLATKPVTNPRRLKSCQASFPTTWYETRNHLQEKKLDNSSLNNMLLNSQ